MEILYKVHNNLYVNLTNRCPYACTFCLRQTMDRIGESDRLWLEREPLAKEVIDEFAKFNMEDYDEVVFCGFGEPTEAFDVLKEVASYVKKTYNKPIRINTNGVGNLINKRDIVPEMEGIIDTVSISLNDPDKKRYNELVRSLVMNHLMQCFRLQKNVQNIFQMLSLQQLIRQFPMKKRHSVRKYVMI